MWLTPYYHYFILNFFLTINLYIELIKLVHPLYIIMVYKNKKNIEKLKSIFCFYLLFWSRLQIFIFFQTNYNNHMMTRGQFVSHRRFVYTLQNRLKNGGAFKKEFELGWTTDCTQQLTVKIVSFYQYVVLERTFKNCLAVSDVQRDIGKSFQLAIITTRINLIVNDNATAQS